MKKTPIVYAIVVTYNRLNFLKQCLASIKNQTYPVKKIIVVDNCSTDGTREYLKKLYKKDPQTFQIIFNKDNLGIGNGINLALMTIQVEEWDYVWITDDDNVAEKDCLNILINYIKKPGKNNEIVGPLSVYKKVKNKLVFPMFDFKTKKVYLNTDEIKNEIIYGLSPFNFTLISKKIMTFLDENYFIRGEEVDFYMSNLAKKIQPITITKALSFFLREINFKELNIFNFKIRRELLDDKKFYYTVRNNLILSKKFNFLKKIDKSITDFYFYFKIPFFPIFFFLSNLFSIILFYKDKFLFFKNLLLAYYDFYVLKKFGKRRF